MIETTLRNCALGPLIAPQSDETLLMVVDRQVGEIVETEDRGSISWTRMRETVEGGVRWHDGVVAKRHEVMVVQAHVENPRTLDSARLFGVRAALQAWYP